MYYYLLNKVYEINNKIYFPCLAFIKDKTWNDYGYKTLFRVYHFKTRSNSYELGYYRIMNEKGDPENLLPFFDNLSSDYCSLAVSEDFYLNLFQREPENIKSILLDLNDISVKPEYFELFKLNDCFNKSILRGVSIDYIKKNYASIISGTSEVYNQEFTYACKFGDSSNSQKIKFSFIPLNKEQPYFPYRINCLVGKNATGKTITLAKLALSLCDGQTEKVIKEFPEGRPQYRKIIAVSFSMFDTFEHPNDNEEEQNDKYNINYYYCGFHNPSGKLMTEIQKQERLNKSFNKLKNNEELYSYWLSLLTKFLSPFIISQITESLSNKVSFEDLLRIVSLSSGQYILFYFVTHILANISINSLILFDEPELHLHPNGISQLFEILTDILNKYKSYCILATHSPIIIQQIPKKYINVITRVNNQQTVTKPIYETFGENLSRITRDVFENIDVESFYKQELLTAWKGLYKNVNNVKKIFNDDLSLQATLYLENLKNE